jgi:hypothetical protein
MQRLNNILKFWIPLAVVITLLVGLMYLTEQHILRASVNDPQIQMSEDMARALANGQSVDSVVPPFKIDIAHSVAPYVAVFDDSGKAIASSGVLHNQIPVLPSGVFNFTRLNGQDRITWQPEPGVRSAIVVTRYSGASSGFVMVGRSLRESEARTSQLELLLGAGWGATCFAALVVITLCEIIFNREVHQ